MFAVMKEKKRYDLKKLAISVGILFLVSAVIKIISTFSGWIEAWYATGIYVYISTFLRVITRWVPFSVGDVLYSVLALFFIIKFITFISIIFRRQATGRFFLYSLLKVIRFLLCVYVIFNLLWGLNYERLGIAHQLQIQPAQYSTEELKTLTDSLLVRVNTARKAMGDSNFQYPSHKEVFAEAITAYKNVQQQYSFLAYRQPCIKATLYGNFANYLGFQGYYDPFTGESQVDVTIPPFIIPYTTTHEVSHQIGYGTEDEANFVGYLAGKASTDPLFHYSIYFDLFNYANSALFYRDSAAARANYKALDTLIKKDERAYRKFLISYRNPVDHYMTALYGSFLKANNQPNGMDTYSQVISWLVAYQKKYKEL
jgi:hypothetical protein